MQLTCNWVVLSSDTPGSVLLFCTVGGTRTHTPFRAPPPQSGASTNSATTAYHRKRFFRMLDYKSSPLKIAARFLLSILLVRYVAGRFDGWVQDFRFHLLSLLPSLHLLHVLNVVYQCKYTNKIWISALHGAILSSMPESNQRLLITKQVFYL